MELHVLSEIEILNKCTKKTPKWSFEGLTVNAICLDVYDGDTSTFAFIPYTGCEPKSFRCRLLRYNSAEIKSKDENEKRKAKESRDFLSSMILNKIVKLQLGKFDMYGRILVEVYLPDGKNVNDEMLKTGHGMPYNGTGPKLY